MLFPNRYIVGVDPGFSGALALLRGSDLIDIRDMPKIVKETKGKMSFDDATGKILRKTGTRNELDRKGLRAILEEWRLLYGVDTFIREKVSGRKGEGHVSVFRFGQNAEAPEAMAIGLGYENFLRIAPITWKKALGCTSLKETSIREAKARVKGSEAFLTLKKHDGRAEAMLIGLAGNLGLGEQGE